MSFFTDRKVLMPLFKTVQFGLGCFQFMEMMALLREKSVLVYYVNYFGLNCTFSDLIYKLLGKV